MNNFSKLYTAKTLKDNKVVTIVSLPMEESLMVPVAQIIDLMKQGENVIFFSFTHDSIKVNNFMQEILKNEPNPENITGMNAVFDIHQIPAGKNWIGFIEDTIDEIKKGCEINYVFMDIIPYVANDTIKPGDDELVVSTATLLAFTRKITPIIIKSVDVPMITATQDSEKSKKIMDEFMSKDLIESLKTSRTLLEQSDYIIGIQREKKSFWKKIINFLLFWRKKNNFTLKVLKDRNGKNGTSYRMNLDMDNFKTEVL